MAGGVVWKLAWGGGGGGGWRSVGAEVETVRVKRLNHQETKGQRYWEFRPVGCRTKKSMAEMSRS